MRKSDLFFNVLRLPVDFVMLISAGLATYFFRTEILSSLRPVLFEVNLPIIDYLYLVVISSFLFLAVFATSGLYSMRSRLTAGNELVKIIIASSSAILLVIIYIFLRQELFYSRFLVLGGWFFAILFVFAGRIIVKWAQIVAISRYGFGIHKLVLIGNNETALRVIAEIGSDKKSGYKIIKKIPVLNLGEITKTINTVDVDEIILADSGFSQEDMSSLIELCQEHQIIFKFIPAISQIFSTNLEFDIFKGFPLVEVRRTSLDGWGRIGKRIFDIIGSIIGLVLFSPLFAIMSFAIKWETDGPVFVRLRRISGNKELELLKFRSMVNNAESLKPYLASMNERNDGPLFKIKNDPRITKVGRLIRKTRMDELPQLWNVLKGDISLIGPRPHQPDEIANYQRHHRRVLSIKGGATGLAQTSGSSDLSFEEEVALDTYYIENWSLWLDAKIILKTAVKMFFDRSAV